MKLNPFNFGTATAEHEGNGNGNGHAVANGKPHMSEAEFQKIKTEIHRELLDSLDLSKIGKLDDDQLNAHIRKLAQLILEDKPEVLQDMHIDEDRLVEELIAESFGLGPLEPYMHDHDVSDILVNGPGEVYVERMGVLQETNTVFADDEHLMQIISRVVARVGRRIDEHSPMVDARLPDGSRVNAIIPPLSLEGPVLSIRRFGKKPMQIEDLVNCGSLCPEMVKLLEAATEGRVNIMISGGTGAGKTTLLNNMSRFVPMYERLVTIEDSAELLLQRKHVVKLETRPPNAEGEGHVSQRDLVRNALRMRPDRIILGEVRGGEALDMLQAMNTGHEGSLTTIHANGTRDALSRLEVMVSMSGYDLPVTVVRRYVSTAINLVVHLARLKGGIRRVLDISEIVGLENGDYTMRPIFTFEQHGVDDNGVARGCFHATGNEPHFLDRLHEIGVDLPASLFEKRQLGEIQSIPAQHREGFETLEDQE